MAQVNLQVTVRDRTGKSYRKELSRRDMVPGVVYGKSVGSIPVEMEYKPLRNILAGNRNAIIDLAVQEPGGDETRNYKVMVKDMDYDPIKRVIRNVDFYQISMDNAIQVGIPIELTGKVAAGILQYGLRELQVSCLPGNIPEGITASLDGMTVGDTITVQDLAVPENVVVLDDPAAMVATVVAQRVEAEEPADEEEGEGLPEAPGTEAEEENV